MKPLYPLAFEPKFQSYLWGGRNLETVLGRTIPQGVVAESWEISAHPAAPTAVSEGPLTGVSLPDLVVTYGSELVGRRGRWALERGQFPLLIKLLDAHQPLSVQVHPDDRYATEHEDGELGKTEMWYVLHAEPGAHIIAGIRKGVTKEAFRAAIEDGTLSECLHRVPVTSGDSILIRAGTVHAIMDGIVLAEVQQSSNTTYRVYDWNRAGPDGVGRELHIHQALQVIDWQAVEPGCWTPEDVPSGPGIGREVVAACDKFVVERITLSPGACWDGALDGETFEAWGVLSGSGQISAGRYSNVVEAVSFRLLPASLGPFEVRATEPFVALRIFLPEVGAYEL